MVDAPPANIEWVMDQAADYWRSQGVHVGPLVVSGTVPDPRYAADASPQAGQPARIRVNWGWMRETTRQNVAAVALHETVHVAQGLSVWTAPRPWIEGQAEALTTDNLCPFMARVWGLSVALNECQYYRSVYRVETASYRRYSAQATGAGWPSITARRWRMNNLREVSYANAGR